MPIIRLDQHGRDDYADTPKSIREYVQEDPSEIIIFPVRQIVEAHESYKIDDKSEYGHQNKHISLYLRYFHDSLDAFDEDFDAHEDQEHGVDEARQYLVAHVPVGMCGIHWLLGDIGGVQADGQGSAVKAHVDGIRYQA